MGRVNTFVRFFETPLPSTDSNVVKVEHDDRDEIVPMNLIVNTQGQRVLQGIVVTRPS
jgi:hypothetical protein